MDAKQLLVIGEEELDMELAGLDKLDCHAIRLGTRPNACTEETLD